MEKNHVMGKSVCHATSVHRRYDTRIFYKECVSLVKAGWDVTLAVCDGEPDEIRFGVKICSLLADREHGRIRRMCSVYKNWARQLLAIDAEIYHLHDPELLSIAGQLKKGGKKVIFDSHENIPMDIQGKSWIPAPLRKPIAAAYTAYERSVLNKIDGVISTTEQITTRLKKANKNTTEITNYPIWQQSVLQKMAEGNRYICFAGGVNESWMHENIISAITPEMNIRYLLMGPGTEEYVGRLKKLENWKYVDFLGKVSYEDVKKNYAKSLLGVAVFEYNEAIGWNEGTLGNTKIFEIMAAGLPVLCSDQKIWRRIVEENQCGVCVNPYAVEEIQKGLHVLLGDPKEAKRMGIRGMQAVGAEYNWNSQEKKLIECYERIVGQDDESVNKSF